MAGGDSMIEALMKDQKGIEVRLLKGNECLVDASVAKVWYAVRVVLRIDFFEMDSVSASFR